MPTSSAPTRLPSRPMQSTTTDKGLTMRFVLTTTAAVLTVAAPAVLYAAAVLLDVGSVIR